MTAPEQLRGHLVQLRARVDAHFEAAVARSPSSFRCAEGCDACCHQRFSVFEVEAAPVREALARLAVDDPALRQRVADQGADADLEHCALLVDGRCAVYEQRPMICRSHGLPVAVPDPSPAPEDPPGTLVVDRCPLNFTDAPPPRDSVLILDAVNRPLSVLAELWSSGAPRVGLAALARATPEK